MPHNHSSRKLMNIRDQNIIFDEDFCKDETIKGIESKVFQDALTY